MLYEVDMIMFLEQPTDGPEVRVLCGAHQLEQQRLRGGEGHVRRALQSLQGDLTVICPCKKKIVLVLLFYQ